MGAGTVFVLMAIVALALAWPWIKRRHAYGECDHCGAPIPRVGPWFAKRRVQAICDDCLR
jgi:hypothetical protein